MRQVLTIILVTLGLSITSIGFSKPRKYRYKYKKVTKIVRVAPPKNTLSIIAANKAKRTANDSLELDYRPDFGILYQRHLGMVVLSVSVSLDNSFFAGLGVDF